MEWLKVVLKSGKIVYRCEPTQDVTMTVSRQSWGRFWEWNAVNRRGLPLKGQMMYDTKVSAQDAAHVWASDNLFADVNDSG